MESMNYMRMHAGHEVPIGEESPPRKAGVKHDEGKIRAGLVVLGFSRALEAVSKVGTFGAIKYVPGGWLSVPDAEARYTDALMRHLLKESQEQVDPESGLMHAAHSAWNALARLELMLLTEEVRRCAAGD